LRSVARKEPDLSYLLERTRLRTPTESAAKESPNAYAVPGIDERFIIIESRFVGQIAALSAAGAYLAWADKITRYQNMVGATEGVRAQICAQLARTDHDAKENGIKPVFTIKLDEFPESADPPTRRFLQALMGEITDQAMVWFLLHEVGHLARGDKRVPGEPKVDSRNREVGADRWASQTMTRLGFGLFGPEQYLLGRAVVDKCLASLGYVEAEIESTHPSWGTREFNMRTEFDVYSAGAASIGNREFYFPADGRNHEEMDIFVFLRQPLPYGGIYISRGMVSQQYHHIPAAFEYRGKSITAFLRGEGGGRIELRIPDVDEPISIMSQTTFDAMNRQTGVPVLGPALQSNSKKLDWLEVVPGIRFGDLLYAQREVFRKSLVAVGAPAEIIPSILGALSEDEPAMVAIDLAYTKGELSREELDARGKALDIKHTQKLVALLGADRYARFVEIVKGDPVLSKWAPGGRLIDSPDYYRKLEDELIQQNR